MYVVETGCEGHALANQMAVITHLNAGTDEKATTAAVQELSLRSLSEMYLQPQHWLSVHQ